VPTQKYSKYTAIKPLNHKMLWPVRTYSTSTNKEQDQHNINKPNLNKDSLNPLVYVNAYYMKKTNFFFIKKKWKTQVSLVFIC
jgi:hypothetical protein